MKLKFLLITLLGTVMIALLGSTLRINYLQTVDVLNKNWQREIDLTISSLAGTLTRWAGGELAVEDFTKEANSVISNEIIRGSCLEIDLKRGDGESVYAWQNSTLAGEMGLLKIFTKQMASPEKQNLKTGVTRFESDTVRDDIANEVGMVRPSQQKQKMANVIKSDREEEMTIIDPLRFKKIQVYIKDKNLAPAGLLIVWFSNAHFLSSVGALQRLYLLIFLGATIPIVLLAWILGGFISRPVERVAHSMHLLTEGKTDIFINETGSLEVRELIRSFNVLSLEMEKKERMEKELQAARQVQSALVPHAPPSYKNWHIYGVSAPALEVGGDFFYHEIYDSLLCGIGDVSGKGMSAALSVALSLGSLKTLLRKMESIESALFELNKTLLREIKEGFFLALNLIEVNADNQVLRIVNAGQPFPLLYRHETGTVNLINIEDTSLPLGLTPDLSFSFHEVDLYPRDTIVLYSDGAVEMMNPRKEMVGFEGLQHIVESSADPSIKVWSQAILSKVMDYTRGYPQHDDITLLLACYDPEDALKRPTSYGILEGGKS